MTVRTRTSGGLTQPWTRTSKSYPVSCSNRTISTVVTAIPFSTGETLSTTDEVVPDFHRKRSKGAVFFNSFVQRRYKSSSLGSSLVRHTTIPLICTGPPITQYAEYSGQHFLNWLVSTGNPPTLKYVMDRPRQQSLVTETWTDCLAKRQNGLANLVESLAEMDKTWSMVGSPLENVVKLNREFKKAKELGRKRILASYRKKLKSKNPLVRAAAYVAQTKALADFLSAEWLRYRYGIRPMVSDIQVGFKALTEVYDIGPKRYTSRSSSNVVERSVTSGSIPQGSYFFTYQGTHAEQFSVRAMFLDEYRRTPFNKLGITFKNVLGVAWELTHFSFVVDWFVNVGDLIYANLPLVGVNELGGCFTTVDRCTSFYSVLTYGTTDPNTAISGVPSDTVLLEETWKVRIPSTMARAGLVLKDDFRFEHFNRAVDAIALIQQQLPKLFGKP